jgi:hypothetical protein
MAETNPQCLLRIYQCPQYIVQVIVKSSGYRFGLPLTRFPIYTVLYVWKSPLVESTDTHITNTVLRYALRYVSIHGTYAPGPRFNVNTKLTLTRIDPLITYFRSSWSQVQDLIPPLSDPQRRNLCTGRAETFLRGLLLHDTY